MIDNRTVLWYNIGIKRWFSVQYRLGMAHHKQPKSNYSVWVVFLFVSKRFQMVIVSRTFFRLSSYEFWICAGMVVSLSQTERP